MSNSRKVSLFNSCNVDILDSTLLVEKPNHFGCRPLTLSWRKTPRLENYPPSTSPSLESCLKELEEICFFVKENGPTKANYSYYRGLLGYTCTPLTFSLLSAGMAKFGLLEDFKPKILPQMALAWKTLEDLMEHEPTVIVTATFPKYLLTLHHFIRDETRWLRLVLLPNKLDVRERVALRECQWKEINDLHYIDNFDLRYLTNPDGSVLCEHVSFLLPQNHCLERTHSGKFVSLIAGSTIVDLGKIKHMGQEEYRKRVPISSSSPASPTNKTVQEDFHTQVLLKLLSSFI